MMTKQFVLEDLKQKYNQVGHPVYMGGINAIKNYYQNKLSIKDIRNFLARSRTYTTHYEFKPVKHNPYYIRRLRQMLQVDLTDISKISEYNDGYNFILVAIDCFSRKIWVRLLKRKTKEEVLSQIQSMMQEIGHVEAIHCDRGNEFVNDIMRDFCQKNRIILKHPYNTGHAPHVERVQLTLQNLIYKYITSTVNFRFIDKLDGFVNTYNSRIHRMTKISPNDGELKENHEHIRIMHEKYYNTIKSNKIHFKVGDFVRIARLKPKFGRGYDKKTPEAIFKISSVITKFPRVLYELSTWGGEEKIIGNFYQEQLTRVIEQDEFIIEKVLRKKKGKLLVKFLGYLTPEWVSEKDITNIKDIHH